MAEHATAIVVHIHVEAVSASGQVVETADGRGVLQATEENLGHLSALVDAGFKEVCLRAQGPWEGAATGKRRRMVGDNAPAEPGPAEG